MSRIQLCIFVVILLAIQFANADNGFLSRPQKRSNYYGTPQSDTSKQKLVENAELKKPETAPSKRSFLSAWGIIGIILTIIILSTGGYYAFVLRPYLCKKERSYDMIELAHVA